MKRPATVVLSLLLLPAVAAAGVVVVAADGSGDSISVAGGIALAAPGDIVLIRPGDYLPIGPFETETLVVDKSLSLIGDVGGETIISALRVRDLAPGDRVVVRNLTVDDPSVVALAFLGNAMEVTNSQGVVLIEDCDIRGITGKTDPQNLGEAFDAFAALLVEDSTGVVVSRSSLTGGLGFSTPFGLFDLGDSAGGDGLVVRDGHAAVYHSTILGGDGGSDLFYDGGGNPGGHGATVESSDVRFVGTTVEGGAGGDTCSPPLGFPCNGGDGLLATGASVIRAIDSTFTRGSGGEMSNGDPAPNGEDVAVEAGSALLQFPDVAPELTGPVVLREGDAGALSITGEPGTTVRIFFSLDFVYAPLSGKKGVFAMGTPFIGPLLLGTMPVAGQFDIPLVGPDLLGLDGLLTTWQVYTSPGVGIILSNPHELLLGAAGL